MAFSSTRLRSAAQANDPGIKCAAQGSPSSALESSMGRFGAGAEVGSAGERKRACELSTGQRPSAKNPRTRYTATRLWNRFVMRCWLFAGPAGQIAVRLLALRIGPMLDARCENPRRRDANGAKHQCRNQRGCEVANQAKLLISPREARRTGWSPEW